MHFYKKLILIFLFIYVSNSLKAQFSENLLIDEYNEKGILYYGFKTGVINPAENNYYHYLASIDHIYNGTDGMSYALESLIIMYKTTKDKAYLYEFIRHTLELQHWRGNYNGVPASVCFSTGMYMDGLLCWAFSHFVYVVMYQELSNLAYQPLYQFDFIQPANNHFNTTFSTFYDFANWLRIRTEETLDFYTYGMLYYGAPANSDFAYWKNGADCYAMESDGERAAHINMQSPWGAALLYLGITDPYVDYRNKAASIAAAYHGNRVEQNCPDFLGGNIAWGSNEVEVLELNATKNNYVWNHAGWRKVLCSDFTNNEDNEDISHAVQSLIFPMAVYEVYGTTNANFFLQQDYIRFRNTFVKNVFAGYGPSDNPDLHAAVDGDDNVSYNTNISGLNNSAISKASISWMNLHHWDNADASSLVTATEPSLYEILMNASIEKDCLNNIYGYSQLVAAQYEKDCPNVYLYNRNLVYNQDFNAKNSLIINPEVAGAQSYADPVMNDNIFYVYNGVTSNLTAGESITLLPGFEAKAGSTVKMSILPNQCTNGNRVASLLLMENPNDSTKTKNFKKQEQILPVDLSMGSNILIYPNPGQNAINIFIPGNNLALISIFDMLGNLVFENTYFNDNNTLNIEGLSNGIYSIKIKTENKIFVKKLVKK